MNNAKWSFLKWVFVTFFIQGTTTFWIQSIVFAESQMVADSVSIWGFWSKKSGDFALSFDVRKINAQKLAAKLGRAAYKPGDPLSFTLIGNVQTQQFFEVLPVIPNSEDWYLSFRLPTYLDGPDDLPLVEMRRLPETGFNSAEQKLNIQVSGLDRLSGVLKLNEPFEQVVIEDSDLFIKYLEDDRHHVVGFHQWRWLVGFFFDYKTQFLYRVEVPRSLMLDGYDHEDWERGVSVQSWHSIGIAGRQLLKERKGKILNPDELIKPILSSVANRDLPYLGLKVNPGTTLLVYPRPLTDAERRSGPDPIFSERLLYEAKVPMQVRGRPLVVEPFPLGRRRARVLTTYTGHGVSQELWSAMGIKQDQLFNPFSKCTAILK